MFRMMFSASGVTCGFSPVTSSTAPRMSRTVRKPTTAKKPITKRRMPSDISGQRTVAQQMIGEDARHHRLAHRNGANADAGVVPAMGRDLDLVTVDIDGTQRVEDRARRLDREPGDDVLTRRNPPEDAPRIVRQEHNPAILHPHFVGVVLPLEGSSGEARTDLDTLDRVDRHQPAGEVPVELVVDRLS